jgi:hypothetical protein
MVDDVVPGQNTSRRRRRRRGGESGSEVDANDAWGRDRRRLPHSTTIFVEFPREIGTTTESDV